MAIGLGSDSGLVGAGGELGEGEDARWVRSFLLAQPGKTFRIEGDDDAREAAVGEAVAAAVLSLIDEVVRGAGSAGQVDAPELCEPS